MCLYTCRHTYVHMFTKECACVYVYVGTGITHFSHTIFDDQRDNHQKSTIFRSG